VSVLQYDEEGFLPWALLNYLVRLGWSHGDQEVFTLEEMIAVFDIKNLNKAAAAFNPEKLLWLNQQHMMRSDPADVAPYLRAQLRRLGLDTDDQVLLEGVVRAQRERAKTLKEMAQNSRYFFTRDIELDPKAAKKHLTTAELPMLEQLRGRLVALPRWSASALNDILKVLAAELGVGLGKIAQPLRVAVTGSQVSPPIDVTLELLGRETTLARLDAGIAQCRVM
jgi:glutamyl-tRNA synthetase